MILNVGDRVKTKNGIFANLKVPATGTIVWYDDITCDGGELDSDIVNDEGYTAGVEFDEKFENGHTLDGHIDSERGRYGNPDELELIELKLQYDGNYW